MSEAGAVTLAALQRHSETLANRRAAAIAQAAAAEREQTPEGVAAAAAVATPSARGNGVA